MERSLTFFIYATLLYNSSEKSENNVSRISTRAIQIL